MGEARGPGLLSPHPDCRVQQSLPGAGTEEAPLPWTQPEPKRVCKQHLRSSHAQQAPPLKSQLCQPDTLPPPTPSPHPLAALTFSMADLFRRPMAARGGLASQWERLQEKPGIRFSRLQIRPTVSPSPPQKACRDPGKLTAMAA